MPRAKHRGKRRPGEFVQHMAQFPSVIPAEPVPAEAGSGNPGFVPVWWFDRRTTNGWAAARYAPTAGDDR